MEYVVSDKVFEERASTVFVKITDTIYQVKKDRHSFFSGESYIDNKKVLDSLNHIIKVVIINRKGQLIHKNF